MSEPNLRDTFGNFLIVIGKRNQKIVVLDCDLSSSTRTHKFAKNFPKRFFNFGIAEQNMVGAAMGFAISGKIPIVSGFSIFTTGRAWEFIRLAAHDNLNIKIITTHSGFVGKDGSTHHALEDLSLMSTLPNLKVLIPLDNIELTQMLEYSIKTDGPFYVRLPRGSLPQIHESNYHFSIGKPEILKEGKDICLIGTGYGSSLGYYTAPVIKEKFNINVKVLNLSSTKPIDEKELINQIKNCKGIVIIEEHNIYCGFGSILSRIISKHIPIIMKYVGVQNTFGQSGTRESLLNSYGLNKNAIIKQVKSLLEGT